MKTLSVVTMILCLSMVAAADELVENGSFEYPYAFQENTICGTTPSATNQWFCYAQSPFDGMEWVVKWVYNDLPGMLEFWRGDDDNNTVQGIQPTEGRQLVELDTESGPGGNSNVRIYQTIATCPGASYELSYNYMSRPPTSTYRTDVLSVSWAGDSVASHSGQFSSWQNGTASLQGKFGLTNNLEFISGGNAQDVGMLLDNVSLVGPNPATPNACTTINIKPYSDPNSINACSSGVVPVTIWGSASFDVNMIDPLSLSLGGASVRSPGKSGRYQCSISDSGSPDPSAFDGIGGDDGYPDLTCQFTTEAGTFPLGVETATVDMTVCANGFSEGCINKATTQISANDAIRIVRDGCE